MSQPANWIHYPPDLGRKWVRHYTAYKNRYMYKYHVEDMQTLTSTLT